MTSWVDVEDRVVRFPAQVTVVLESGCGSEEAGCTGSGGEAAHTGPCLLGAYKSQGDP